MTNTPNLELETVRVLVNQARDGDHAAQSDLALQVHGYVLAMSNRKLDPNLRANVSPSDIAQQTLIRMCNGIEGFRGESKEEFYGWLNRIIANEAARTNRDLKRQKRDVRRCQTIENREGPASKEPIDYHPTPGTHAISRERMDLFYQALNGLSDDYATVIRLRNLEQLSFKEIALEMKRTVNSVSKIWYRAIVKFQQEYERLDGVSQQ